MEDVVPVKTLVLIAAALITLLAISVALSFVDLGPLNFPVAIAIAAVKAALVVLFFMEVRHSGPVVKAMASAGLLWLILLIAGSLSDLVTRIPTILPFP